MRLTVEERRLIGKAVDRGVKKTSVAEVLGVTRKTVYKWDKRRKHLKDRARKPKESKITIEIEISILALRNGFDWGTARIQQGLFCLPEYMLEVIPNCVQGVKLSRPTINGVLKKHKLNGYKKQEKEWKFIHAKEPNELWQIDLKGPYTVQGKKYHFAVCIDDYSRYIIVAEQFDHVPTSKELQEVMRPHILEHKPKSILSDNGPQFRKQWEKWCKDNNINPIFAHPYYPQDKGKVERAIGSISQEFIYHLKKFPEWLHGKLKSYKEWFNEKRFHRGISAIPFQLFNG